MKHLRILLADDNQLNQKVICMLLRRLQLKCDVAGDGQEALEFLLNNRYDVLFLDLNMPYLNGIEVLEKIREKPWFDQLYVVALTAVDYGETKKRFMAAGCDDALDKPIDRTKLERILKKAVERREA